MSNNTGTNYTLMLSIMVPLIYSRIAGDGVKFILRDEGKMARHCSFHVMIPTIKYVFKLIHSFNSYLQNFCCGPSITRVLRLQQLKSTHKPWSSWDTPMGFPSVRSQWCAGDGSKQSARARCEIFRNLQVRC